MPKFDIKKEIVAKESFRTNAVLNIHDINTKHVKETFKGNIDIENKEWNIGIIVGKSGSGKTTIARECFKEFIIDNYKWSNKSIVDDMPKKCSNDEIHKTFSSVGFASPPSWLKPFGVLSNGEKMRVELARAMLENKEKIVFDEFTSVVDREVAKAGSYAIQKSIRRDNKKFIAIACHRDIIDWLQPDWIYDTDLQEFFFIKNQRDLRDQVLKSQLLNAKEMNGSILESFII